MRKPRSSRDPDAPKAATSAQQFYAKARREALKAKNPELKGTELQEKIADEWRGMSARQRDPYNKQAAKDKARFEKETSEYTVPVEFLKATKNGNRLQKDPLRPKKPKSAYLYFGEATRAELSGANPGIRIEQLSKLIGEEWKKLNGRDKAPYEKLAEEDKERYRKEMEDYTPSEAYLAARKAFKKAQKSGAAWNDDSAEELAEL